MNETIIKEQSIPVYILSGFLGSGKTTLLVQLIEHWQQQGLRPAVVMNELGEVNLDGQIVDSTVPMTEMLGGCICCTVRGDLGLQLADLVQEESPDVIIIEATGAANPMEILDAVTETSLYMRLELKSLITVVDAKTSVWSVSGAEGADLQANAGADSLCVCASLEQNGSGECTGTAGSGATFGKMEWLRPCNSYGEM